MLHSWGNIAQKSKYLRSIFLVSCNSTHIYDKMQDFIMCD